MENKNDSFREGLVGNTQSPNELAKNDANEDVQKLRDILSEEEKKFSEEEIESYNKIKKIIGDGKTSNTVTIDNLQELTDPVQGLIINYLKSIMPDFNSKIKNSRMFINDGNLATWAITMDVPNSNESQQIGHIKIDNIDFIRRCLNVALNPKNADDKSALKEVMLNNQLSVQPMEHPIDKNDVDYKCLKKIADGVNKETGKFGETLEKN